MTFREIAGWAVTALALSPMIFGLGWGVFEHFVRPLFIPRAEIERIADQIMRDHPEDPQEWAFMEEHAAWFRSHTAEQGKWRRVRRELRRRLG